MADDTNTAEREATYLCQAWGETDLPSAAIVRGLDAVRAFLVEQWLGDEDQEHDDGTKALPAAMADMQEQWDLEGEAWKWSISFEIGGISVQRVDDVGRASLAASAGSEPVAWTTGLDWRADKRFQSEMVVKLTREAQPKYGFTTPLYTHPSPPEGMAEWRDIATAPKDCLVDILNAGRRYAGCHYDRICGEYRHVTACGVLIRLKNATHWMPAPPLPASAAKEL